MQITATLKEARFCDDDPRSPNVSGLIYGDIRRRFPDGTYVWTSKITKILPDNIVVTRNSVYKVEWKAEQ